MLKTPQLEAQAADGALRAPVDRITSLKPVAQTLGIRAMRILRREDHCGLILFHSFGIRQQQTVPPIGKWGTVVFYA